MNTQTENRKMLIQTLEATRVELERRYEQARRNSDDAEAKRLAKKLDMQERKIREVRERL